MINTEQVNALAMETILPPAPAIPKLRPADRCDCRECPAQALYRVEFEFDGPSILDFCGHHFDKNLLAILEWGGLVVDMVSLHKGAPGAGA